jgi:hypothetical protein
MIFVQRRKAAPYFPKLKEEDVRQFLPEDIGLEFLDGVLVLDTALSSVASDSVDMTAPDPEIQQLFFGIRTHYHHESRWTVLPGAPMAFVRWNDAILTSSNKPEFSKLELRKAVQGVDDVRNLKELIANGLAGEQFEIDDCILEQVKQVYDKKDHKVVSFLSFPLIEVEGSPVAFGVLNVHCDRKFFLGEVSPEEARRRQQTFAGLVTPMVFDIGGAVKMWWVTARTKYT